MRRERGGLGGPSLVMMMMMMIIMMMIIVMMMMIMCCKPRLVGPYGPEGSRRAECVWVQGRAGSCRA